MASIRRLPGVERRAFRGAVVDLLKYGAFAAAVWFGVHTFWPDDETSVDRATVVKWGDRVVLVFGAIALWCAGAMVLRLVRWRRAVRWERMLADPDRAHLVPPLEQHATAVRDRTVLRAVSRFLIVALIAVVATSYGILALTDRVPRLRSDGEDRSAVLLLGGAFGLWWAWRLARDVSERRLARSVERLSNDLRLVGASHRPAEVASHRAPEIPELVVRHGSLPGTSRRRAAGTPPLGGDDGLHVAYFRLFDNVEGTERFLRSHWRRIGYVHLLRSADQVDPSEIEAAKDQGSVASMFISGQDQFDDALARQSSGRIDAPMPERGPLRRWRWSADPERGCYPVRALLCHGSFWQTAVDLLLDRVDYAVIDLIGFLPTHTGTSFELQRAIDRFPVERLVLQTDSSSDQQFLAAQVRLAWSRMAAGSPNAGTGTRTVVVSTVSEVVTRRARR
jgi:hypothetical protein